MLFVFRGIRFLQVALAVFTLTMGVSCVVFLNQYADQKAALSIVVAIVFGGLALWGFATTLRMPTSFIAVSDERTRIRFAGFIDTVIANSDVTGVRVTNHPWYAGIGVRSNMRGLVALVGAWGPAAEIDLRRPVRVWLVPKLIPLRAQTLRVSVRNPQKLVERFGPGPASTRPLAASTSPRTGKKKKR